MLFNSFEFIIFLPTVVLLYFWAGGTAAKQVILIVASIFFYGWWRIDYVPLLAGSIGVNFLIARTIAVRHDVGGSTKVLLTAGVAFNLLLLGTFKYMDFAVATLNEVGLTSWALPGIILPLAISFFTFQQIAYLADAAAGKISRSNFLEYALFVTFFPQLIAGPIVHHGEMMPQFAHRLGKSRLTVNLMIGLFIFSCGLAKKILLADNLAPYADIVFSTAEAGTAVPFFQAWSGALAYTLQLYFDFSGYSDMAIGIARMFGIKLPLNFHSPYKACSIIEFWKRWHITLSRFLRDYLYIPLGGSRVGVPRKYTNVMITMLLGGLWHGAGWTFVIWGGLHGVYLALNQVWRSLGFSAWLGKSRAYRFFGLMLTFFAVVVGWVIFRAESLSGAQNILSGMAGLNGILAPKLLISALGAVVPVLTAAGVVIEHGDPGILVEQAMLLMGGLGIVWFMPNVQQMLWRYSPAFDTDGMLAKDWDESRKTFFDYRWLRWRPSPGWAVVHALILALTIITGLATESPFLYFQF